MSNKHASSCGVCLDLFSPQPPHRPKMLLCGHTTCETCIHQWTHRSNPPLVQCPHCRRQFGDLKNVDDDVPVNYALLDMMAEDDPCEIAQSKGQRKRAKNNSKRNNNAEKCEITPHCNQPATHRCLQCPQRNQRMCKDHLLQHSSFKAFSATHHPIRIEDLPPPPLSYLAAASSSSLVPPSCADHIGLPLTIHCWDCKKAVCDRCALFAHKTHSYSEIHQAADKIKMDLQAKLDLISKMMDDGKMIIDDLAANMEWLRREEEELLKTTDRMCDEMHETLENVRILMKKRVVDVIQQRRVNAAAMMKEATTMREAGEKIMKAGKAVMGEKDSGAAVYGGLETCHESERFEDEYRHRIDIDKVKMMVTKKEEEERGVGIDLDRMKEAKMMMEEGLRGVIAGCWKGYVEDNNSRNGSDDESNNNVEKKRMEIRRVMKGGLSLKPAAHIECKAEVYGVAWSADGNSLYVSGGGGGLREIDIESGDIIGEIAQGKISSSRFIAVSKAGDIYVCDPVAQKVYVVSSSTGDIIREIGSIQGDGDGQFDKPYSVCIVDDWNEVFVADENNHRIQVFSTIDGHFIRKFGSQGKEQGKVLNPVGIAVDTEAGLVIVTECCNNRIQVFDRDGNSIRTFASHGEGNDQLKRPHGIAVDPISKQMIVCDFDNHRLSIFDYEGNFIGNLKSSLMNSPLFVSIRNDRRLAISSYQHKGVFFRDLFYEK